LADEKKPFRLSVRIQGKDFCEVHDGGDFDGSSVWIGLEQGDNLTVPSAVQAAWQKDLADAAVAGQVLSPRPGPKVSREIKEGQRVQALLFKQDKRNKPHAQTPVLPIRKVLGIQDMVQAVQLDID
jgi:hypothetical protein